MGTWLLRGFLLEWQIMKTKILFFLSVALAGLDVLATTYTWTGAAKPGRISKGLFKQLSVETRNGYAIERWEFYPEKDLAVEALVLIPSGVESAPAVICMADAGGSIEHLAGESDPYATPDAANGRKAYFAAKSGCVAVALSMPAMANAAPDDVNSADSRTKYLALLPDSGWTDQRLVSREIGLCADFIKTLSCVDRTRVGVCGFGASSALVAAAIPESPSRVTAAGEIPVPASVDPVPSPVGGTPKASGKRMMCAADYEPERADGRTKRTMTWAMMKLRAANPPSEPWYLKDATTFANFCTEQRAAYANILAKWNLPSDPVLTLVRSEHRAPVGLKGYTLNVYELEPIEDLIVKTMILVPDDAQAGKTPAVVCFPGTAGSLECLAGEPDPYLAESPVYTLRNRQAWWYAQVGMIGIALENCGNANNAFDDMGYSYSQVKGRELLGRLGIGEGEIYARTTEMIIRWLKRHQPLLDATKIASSGLSLGAGSALTVASYCPDICAYCFNDFVADGLGRRIATTDLPSGVTYSGGAGYASIAALAPKHVLLNEGGQFTGVIDGLLKAYAYAGHPERISLHYYDRYGTSDKRLHEDKDLRACTGLTSDQYFEYCNVDPDQHSIHSESALPWICNIFWGEWKPSAALQAEIDRTHAETAHTAVELFPPDGITGRKCAPLRSTFQPSDYLPERADGKTEKTVTWAAMQLRKRGEEP